jgi:hypothetical protein
MAHQQSNTDCWVYSRAEQALEAPPRSRLAQRFTTSRALVSLLISSFSYLCALNVFTLACVVQTDKSSQAIQFDTYIVVRVFFTNHKVLISSASLIIIADNEVENQPEH